MGNMIRKNKYKQIYGNFIIYLIYIFLGGTALIFFHRLWNTTVGNLIIFMSPYIIITVIIYGYRFWVRSKKRTLKNIKKEMINTTAQEVLE
ncbi:MAG: hypothetical protein ACE5KZ_05915 [Candidatus Scalinduaceae bacterium]